MKKWNPTPRPRSRYLEDGRILCCRCKQPFPPNEVKGGYCKECKRVVMKEYTTNKPEWKKRKEAAERKAFRKWKKERKDRGID